MRNGFTLAEVLITLGVIGVVAALTMPTLIQNHQVASWEAALKKSYSTITNGFHMIAMEAGGDFRDSGLFDDIDDDTFSERIDKAVREHFKVVKSCKIGDTTNCPGYNVKYLKGGSWNVLRADNGYIAYLADGTIMKIKNRKCTETNFIDETKLKYNCAYITVDINGRKGPNTNGKDYFQFGLMNELGDAYPETSLEWAKAQAGNSAALSYNAYWRNVSDQCGTPNKKLEEETANEISGSNCLARIMENGWKMDYLK